MKVEFKHNCEIQGKKFGFEKHMSPGIHEVPDSFKDDWFFKALVNDGHAIILEEAKDVEEKEKNEEIKEVKKQGKK